MQTAEQRDPEILRAFRFRLQQFLQLNHSRQFSVNYLSHQLNIPEKEVWMISAELILEGTAKNTKHTNYIEGIPVDWKAVHEGRAPRPAWAVNR